MAETVRVQVTDRAGAAHRLAVPVGSPLMETLRDQGLGVEAMCGGCCACATCHVLIAPTWQARLVPRGEVEESLLRGTEHFDAAASRLSCQIICDGTLEGLMVTIAPEE